MEVYNAILRSAKISVPSFAVPLDEMLLLTIIVITLGTCIKAWIALLLRNGYGQRQ